MKRNHFSIRWFAVALVAFLVISTGGIANAALKAVAPAPFLVPSGFPAWYQDNNGLALGPCWDFNGFCTLVPPFCPPALGPGCIGTPITTVGPINDLNFPNETFYFDATTVSSIGPNAAGKLTQVIALEGAFGALAPPFVVPGGQITFLRINVRVVGIGAFVPDSTYTVVHPYGTYTFTTDPAGTPIKVGGAGVFRVVDGCAGAPCDFATLLPAPTTNVGPWLVDTAGFHPDAATGNIYIGAGPLSAVTVTGSPNGTNYTSVTGPCANGGGAACLAAPVVSTMTNSFFFLGGKVVGLLATPSAVTFPIQRPLPITSATTTITINNPGLVPATLGAFAIGGSNPADFAIVADTCSNATLAANVGTCSFGVVFSEIAPGVNGPKSAVLSFPTTAPLNMPPVIVNLSGFIDNIPPTVISTIPADEDINVPANNSFVATFSEPVTNVTPSTFTMSGGNPVSDVTGTVGLDATNKIATFYPFANLQSDQTYTATIIGLPATDAVTDIAGNPMAQNFVFNFVTTAPNVTPPSVRSTTPATNATGVVVTDPITVTFRTAIQVHPSSVNATTFFLSEGVTGTVTYNQATRTATFTVDKPLQFFHTYTATVTTGVKSLGGVPMAENYTWSFFTNGAPAAPQLFAPGDGAAVPGTEVDLQWVKSKDVDLEPVTYHVWYCTNPAMVGCTPVDVLPSPRLRDTLAGLGGYGAGILLAGIAIAGGVRSRRKLFFFIALLLISGMVATACGKKSTNPGINSADIMTQHVTGLHAGTAYYWKVVADDGNGALVPSETRNFNTQ